jgi:ATP-dependent RNA circularization protein (DNA/RNA ligase family)
MSDEYINKTTGKRCVEVIDPAAIEGNHFLKSVFQDDIDQKVLSLGRNIAFQSEVIGEPNIQGNIYQLNGCHLYNFNVFDIDAQEYLEPKDQRELATSVGLKLAPLISDSMDITGMTVDDFLDMAGGKTQVGTQKHIREGLVFVANCKERFSFKVVDNSYLMLRGY